MIELKVDKILKDGFVSFHIDYQDNYEHIKSRSWKRSSCGWLLNSQVYPEILIDHKIFYVRGKDTDRDNNKLICSILVYKEILSTINEYNAELS